MKILSDRLFNYGGTFLFYSLLLSHLWEMLAIRSILTPLLQYIHSSMMDVIRCAPRVNFAIHSDMMS